MGADEGGPLAVWCVQVGEQCTPQAQTLPHRRSSVQSLKEQWRSGPRSRW